MTTSPETLRQVADALEALLPWEDHVANLVELEHLLPLALVGHPAIRLVEVLEALPPEYRAWWLRAAIDRLRAEAEAASQEEISRAFAAWVSGQAEGIAEALGDGEVG